MNLHFYEATSTFTFVTTRIVARLPIADFVDGLQKATFPPPPAIHATWLWLFTMTGLPPARKQYPSLGTRRVKEWRVALGIPLAVAAVSSFVPV